MDFHILSDLHLEFLDFKPTVVPADAVLLAGDIGPGTRGIQWAGEHLAAPGRPVIYVPGNHEYYGTTVATWRARAQRTAAACGVQLGDTAAFRLEREGEAPVRVLAATLWTDFALFGDSRVESSGTLVERCLYDYSMIGYQGRKLRWPDTKAFHEATMAWLRSECSTAKAAGEKVVVVAHHGPSLRSVLPTYKQDPVSAGFASNLEEFLSEHVDLFVHGHMHNSSDYLVGRCRVVANPRGYPRQRWNPDSELENKQFNPTLVVTI